MGSFRLLQGGPMKHYLFAAALVASLIGGCANDTKDTHGNQTAAADTGSVDDVGLLKPGGAVKNGIRPVAPAVAQAQAQIQGPYVAPGGAVPNGIRPVGGGGAVPPAPVPVPMPAPIPAPIPGILTNLGFLPVSPLIAHALNGPICCPVTRFNGRHYFYDAANGNYFFNHVCVDRCPVPNKFGPHIGNCTRQLYPSLCDCLAGTNAADGAMISGNDTCEMNMLPPKDPPTTYDPPPVPGRFFP